MKDNFIFRTATIKDLNDVLRLNFELFKLEDKKYDKTLNRNWTYREGKKFFRKRILWKKSFMEVVEYKGKTVGYLCGEIFKGIPWRQKAIYAELDNMFVEGKYRGKKLGTKLVKDFLNWCKKKKVGYVEVVASFSNKNAIGFYNRSGFKDYALILETKISKK